MDLSLYRTPGQLIGALLGEHGWTQRVLGIVLGVADPVVAKMVNDKRTIDADMALQLSDVFGVAPEEFLYRQKDYELAVARFKVPADPGRARRATLFGDLPVADMIKRGWIDASMTEPKKVEAELMRFFGVESVDDITVLLHAAKKTDVASPATPAQSPARTL